MILNINSTRGQTRFLTCVARVSCPVCIKQASNHNNSVSTNITVTSSCVIYHFEMESSMLLANYINQSAP